MVDKTPIDCQNGLQNLEAVGILEKFVEKKQPDLHNSEKRLKNIQP